MELLGLQEPFQTIRRHALWLQVETLKGSEGRGPAGFTQQASNWQGPRSPHSPQSGGQCVRWLRQALGQANLGVASGELLPLFELQFLLG